jgi:hypothetical protein
LKLREEWPLDIIGANVDAGNEKERAKGPVFLMMSHSHKQPLKNLSLKSFKHRKIQSL